MAFTAIYISSFFTLVKIPLSMETEIKYRRKDRNIRGYAQIMLFMLQAVFRFFFRYV